MSDVPRFETTLWSEVMRARDRGSAALDRLLNRYRGPVLDYLRARGLQAADAEDVTQEVFQRLLEADVIAKADRDRGRFRCLLLGVTRNILHERHRQESSLKRGGAARLVSLDPERDQPAAGEHPQTPGDDEQFDRIWVSHLIDQAIQDAQTADRARGTRYMEVLSAKTLEGASYEDLAHRFGLTVSDVKNYLHRARGEIGRQVRRLVEEGCAGSDEYEAELSYVRSLMDGPRKGKPRPAR